MEANNISNNKEEKIKWGGWLNEFLWICAGANREVLRQCPTDYAKYAGIGGTILFTALMAMLSSGYALYFVFESVPKAITFGIFWGILIFNLDRFIVNTMYSDGKVTISWREFYSGLPRIIMAIFLGIVISTPLEMKIFEDRINSQLVNDNIERTNASRAKVDEGNKPLSDRRILLEQQQAEIQDRLAKANEELKKEGEGSSLSGRAGHGQIYKDKEQNMKAIEKELAMWNSSHQQELEDLRKQIKINRNKGNYISGILIKHIADNIKTIDELVEFMEKEYYPFDFFSIGKYKAIEGLFLEQEGNNYIYGYSERGHKDIDKIFNRFYRVDKARTRQKGGFGLGLSLAKQIVDALKGTITVKDNKPKGTVFEVKIAIHTPSKKKK